MQNHPKIVKSIELAALKNAPDRTRKENIMLYSYSLQFPIMRKLKKIVDKKDLFDFTKTIKVQKIKAQ